MAAFVDDAPDAVNATADKIVSVPVVVIDGLRAAVDVTVVGTVSARTSA
jgi:hypothetical protein